MIKKYFFSFRNKIPLIILVSWVSVIGYFIWQRVNQSEGPPRHDAMSYFAKAKNFWENAGRGFHFNPFNVMPGERPPGTVLMSYPIGFNEDYHGFLFRSVFIPFLIWVIAILFLVWPKQNENKKTSYWTATLYVFLLGPMPFFFQFAYGKTAMWGFVDAFFAAVSAISLVLAIKSVEKRSIRWLIAAVFMTLICPLIKPAGYLIFLLVALFWSITILILVSEKNNPEKKLSINFWWTGTVLFFLTGSIIFYLGISSEYLGHRTVDYYSKAISILNKDSREQINADYFFSLFYEVLGPQCLIYFSIFILLFVRFRKSGDGLILHSVFLISGLLFILTGLWFWVWMTGISQIRYFYPFLLLGITPIIYWSHEIMFKQEIRFPPIIQGLIKGLCILPALNILLLLSQTNPDQKWQNISGTSMNIILHDEGVILAKKFHSLLENVKTTPTVYCTDSEETTSFICYNYYILLMHPNANGFNWILPYDWVRPHAFRIHEMILKSDYILYKPMQIDLQVKIIKQFKDSFPASLYEERFVIEAFLNSLTPEQGLLTVLEDKNCKLSKITDKIKLKQAFELFLLSRQWRPAFLLENNITNQSWKLFEKPFEGIPNGYTKDTSTLFGGYIDFPVTDSIQTNFTVTVNGWLAYDPNNGIKADEIFVVLNRPDGTVQYWPTYPVYRPDVSNAYHQPALTEAGFTSLIDISDQKGVYKMMLALSYKGKIIHCDSKKRILINK